MRTSTILPATHSSRIARGRNPQRCIFCKSDSRASTSVEHILPESFGNTEHVLSPGLVCDRCNNYFASNLEQPVLESGQFLMARFDASVPNKRRHLPLVRAFVAPKYHALVQRDDSRDLHIFVEPKAERDIVSGASSRLFLPRPQDPPNRILFARFLGKVAIEAMAGQFLATDPAMLHQLVDDALLDSLRNYVRWGSPQHLEWPVSRRHLYARDCFFTDQAGLEYEVLHEWVFLNTEHQEIYFVLAIFGTEYVINIGGPDLEGYNCWLKAQRFRSPLYPDVTISRFRPL
jgi:HNH endonuclease